jgi:hypothetical protein
VRADVDVTCPDGAHTQEILVAATGPPTPVTVHRAMVSGGSAEAPAPRLELVHADQDGDGHSDLVYTVTVARHAEEDVSAPVVWLDRPGGPARAAHEPEATLTGHATEGERLLAEAPERAEPLLAAVLDLHRAICREGGGPSVRFGDELGVSCGPSVGAGQAASAQVVALARRAATLEALEAFGRLSDPFLLASGAQRETARAALRSIAPAEGVTLQAGPELTPPTSPAIRNSALQFLSDDRLLLTRARVLDLPTGELGPAKDGDDPDVLMSDPSHRLVVTAIHRTCEGRVLAIANRSSVIAGVLVGPPTATPLLEAIPAPEGCSAPPAGVRRHDDGGWTVLGWAAQGPVAARGGRLRVVPLTADGTAPSGPVDVPLGSLPPAPLLSSVALRDGSAYVIDTPIGILLRRNGAPPSTAILRPDGFPESGPVTDLTVSPSGTRVAFARDGRVWILGALPQ